jgi:hypothetical protein
MCSIIPEGVDGDCFVKSYQMPNLKIFSLLKSGGRVGILSICMLFASLPNCIGDGSAVYTTLYRAEK